MDRKTVQTGQYHPLSVSGFFFAPVFLIGMFLEIWILMYDRQQSVQEVVRNPGLYMMLCYSAIFLVSAFHKALAFMQPICLLTAFLIPAFIQFDNIIGISFFISGIILLKRGSFLHRYKRIKILLLILYFYSVEISAAFLTNENIPRTISTIFFISAFILFLYLIFNDSFALKKKPEFSLSHHSLSSAEAVYVRMLAEGKSHKEIAAHCGVSESTVRNTLSRVYKKLKVPDKYALLTILSSHEIRD